MQDRTFVQELRRSRGQVVTQAELSQTPANDPDAVAWTAVTGKPDGPEVATEMQRDEASPAPALSPAPGAQQQVQRGRGWESLQILNAKTEEQNPHEPKSIFAPKPSSLAAKIRKAVDDGRASAQELAESAFNDLHLGDLDDDGLPGEISQVTRIMSLRKSQLLATISGSDLRLLAQSSTLRKLGPNEDLIRVGTISPALYTVVNGNVGVLIAGDKIEVAVIKAGGMVGEMSVLTGQPAGATCRAKAEGCAVLEITKSTLVRLVRERPTLRRHLDAFMAQRLAANEAMMEKMHENKAREQEEKMQKEEATNCLDLHPWVQYYRNENLKVPPDTLAASFFELQMAYGLLLGPTPSRAFVLNRFPTLTEDDLALAQNSANAKDEDLAKANSTFEFC